MAGLALAAVLAACGGGSSSSDNSGGDGGGDTAVTVAFTAPAAEEVFDTGALTVSARVTVNGADASDGVAVTFSGGGRSTSAVTRGGIATATLSGAETGRQQISASAQVSSQSATATRTVYLRPNPAKLEILVPAYFLATGNNSGWSRLTASAAAHPNLTITAILNPNDGVFTSADPNFVRAATEFVAAGGKIVGYVYTLYGTGARSQAAIQANIDNYLTLYGRNLISGIFLDEMAAANNRLDFYRTLYNYIKGRDSNLQVIGNPGTMPIAGYADVADVLVTFERKASDYAGYDPRTENAWLYTLRNTRQSSLVHNAATCAAMQTAVQRAASARYNSGLVYVTNLEFEPSTGAGNPWATLPSYWDALLNTVDAINNGAALPAC